ncbi:hypothetical protein [Psychrobacter urativorans]|uniref:hypothetical protein n=1 Tax=Psychrobacter urativorans TaxID=45610 RepID=UPI003BB79B37
MSYSLRSTTSTAFQLTALSLALVLAGCGGGDTVDSIAPEYDGSTPNTGGGNGNELPIGELNILESKLVDIDGNPITSVSLEGAYYEVKVTNSNGQPAANAKVTFTIDAEGIALSQTTSGATLTDSNGLARIFLKPTAPQVSGAYTITANASNATNSVIDNLDFLVQATTVNLSTLNVTNSQLIAGGQTAVTMTANDTLGNPISGILVNLNANCGQLPSQATSNENGVIEFVYKAINTDNTLCSGNVRISANSGSSTQTANLTIQAPEATSIVYTSNDLTLGIQNSGSSATGEVEFTIYSNRTPLANSEVILSLEKSPLGLSFVQLGNRANQTLRTDANGRVSVNIYPGSTPGPVEIKATLASDSRINALSKGISVASSRPTQDGISLSFGTNALDWSIDGDETPVVARLVDRNGNKVPDGTVVNFTAEGGKVFPSSCTTSDGACSITFSTQNPLPGDGRATILAVVEGEKAYIDQNENNAWDEGIDILVHNIGDTFRDDNENNTFEIGEFTYPLTTQASGMCENNIDKFIQLKFPTSSNEVKEVFANRFFSNFVSPNKPMTCNSGLDAVLRFESVQLITRGENPEFTLLDKNGVRLQDQVIMAPKKDPATTPSTSTSSRVYTRINSGGIYNLNPMPAGTTISGSVTDKTKGTDSGSCAVEMIGGPAVVPAIVGTGRPGDNTGTINTFALDECEVGDFFKISVTSPKGTTTTITYTIQ